MGKGRTLKYDFTEMEVGGDPIIGSVIDDYSIVSCAINYSKRHQLGWKFKSKREGEKIILWRVK